MNHSVLIISLLVLILIAVVAFIFILVKQNKSGKGENQASENNLLKSKLETLSEQKQKDENEIGQLRSKNEHLLQENATLSTQMSNLSEKLRTQKEEMEKLQEKFKLEFENIATKIIKQNTQDFSESSNKNLKQILDPLKENIQEFKKSVSERSEKDTKAQAELKAQLEQLKALNQNIGKEAENLTKALKGDNKAQGNWGELVLEKVLERSGLQKGEEYKTQVFAKTAGDNSNIKPDVVIYLPDDKQIIIDSKVSLTAYEKYVSTEDSEEKERYVKAHLISIRNHIKELAEKNYPGVKDFNSPDFVLLFMPIESAFSLSTQQDEQLFNYAWDRRIVIVSPSTLLATLKTVASIWKQEKQNKNVLQIVEEAGKMYDKFAGFLEDMKRINQYIGSTQKSYDEAMKKLSDGRGNLIDRFEKMKELGANASKKIDSQQMESGL